MLTGKAYTRITGQSLRAILADSLCIPINELPAPRTLRRVLNRNGYVLRSLRKTLLEVDSHQLFITFVSGPATADTTVDQLEHWWLSRKQDYPMVKRLMIDLDNGPEVSSSRRQFMKRLTDFANQQGLEIELVYYPPYHSKYNMIERCWGILERHWNGTQLKTIDDALRWASTMTWKTITPVVQFIDKIYSKGVTMTKQAFAKLSHELHRQAGIDKWSVIIMPKSAASYP